MNERHYTLGRDELYVEVWAEPMTRVSKRYGISDVALAKVCRKMHIPVPERGYWARVAHGQKPKQKPLPPCPKDVPQEVKVRPVNHSKSLENSMPVDPIPVPDTLVEPHKLTLKLQKSLERSQPDMYGRLGSTRDDIDVHVSHQSVPRTLRILDIFIKAAEHRGFSFAAPKNENQRGLSLVIGQQEVEFSIFEISNRISSRPPKDNNCFSSLYESPEYRPPGRLTFKIREYVCNQHEPTFSDTAREPLETKLGTILHAMIHAAQELGARAEKQAREPELARQSAEEARKAGR